MKVSEKKMFTDQNESVELFSLALYQNFKPEEKCRMLVDLFPEADIPFLDWTERVELSHKKKASFLRFRKETDVGEEIQRAKKMGIGWITIFDEMYPEQLRQSYGAPLLLFYKGNLSYLDFPMLGIVGARACTEYGRKVVQTIVPDLISRHIPIVSGLAKGLDTEAHKTTIRLEGKTVGVIGTGIDVCYPAENRSLQREIAKNHLLLSEFPVGTKPKKHHFPYRNRIIAGLSRGVLIVEAKERSGSLITAHQALNEGREVYAVPGSIFNAYSTGCNNLIKYGAKPVVSAKDILEDWSH